VNAPRLDAIQITNFRSIRGTVSIPLDAPVVLLHGTNGAGKSTVMSAIELALTGNVSGIPGADREHLVHHGEEEATVELVSSAGEHALRLNDGELTGEPLLAVDDARFFVERCYLQQRTLTQLLEIYQDDGAAESQLTRFVNDLLGLDELEALLQGTHSLTDKRRVRKLLPEFATLEYERDAAEAELAQLQQRPQDAARTRTEANTRLDEILLELGSPSNADDVEAFLTQEGRESELVDLAGRRRDVLAMQHQAREIGDAPGAKKLGALSKAAQDAREATENWRRTHGNALEDVLASLRGRFPGLPDAGTAQDPAAVRQAALTEVDTERRRLRATVEAAANARAELDRLDAAVADARVRLTSIDAQLADSGSATDAEDLAKTIAALIPHVHTDDCPVCGRTFGEVADEPLVAHLAIRVSQLSERAERISSLAKARLEATNDLHRLDDARKHAASRVMEEVAETRAKAELAFLDETQERLASLEAGVSAGAALIRSLVDAERAVVYAEEQARGYAELVASTRELASASGHAGAEAERVEDTLAALADELTGRIVLAERIEQLREEGRKLLHRIRDQEAEEHELGRRIAAVETRLRERRDAIAAIEERRDRLWNLQREAEAARAAIVSRVFNDALNTVWNDLFVRLAPEEPFVPSFRTPDTSGRRRLIAELATRYRGGEHEAGSPGAMLSAGNLNTAALTLFLALHLSVKTRLPWLLLDDPVQSMDEVHIQQFAALLRTLSKRHGRRVLIAVHERALFDYLSLELSAAQPDDVLVTVELSRSYEGGTVVRPSRLQYVPDRALDTTEVPDVDQ
jgi:DNA repair protein SbcC/Rad50